MYYFFRKKEPIEEPKSPKFVLITMYVKKLFRLNWKNAGS